MIPFESLSSEPAYYEAVARLIKTLPTELREKHYSETRVMVENAYQNLNTITREDRDRLTSLLKD